MDHLMATYKRQPVAFVRGEGCWLWDSDGTQYLDALGGIAVCALGHAHPEIAAAIAEQAATLLHTSNLFRVPLQEKLGTELTRVTGMDNAFFTNSGAEANECAIKLARLYGNKRGVELPTIVVAENSFHGRTLATLSASGTRKIQAGFEPLVRGFVRVPYNDLDALHNVARNSPQVVAIMLEPIQGEGGIRMADAAYLQAVRRLCDQHQWMLILDEIQTGMCRTGAWLASQRVDVKPDIVTLAKALGNGVPIGACLAHGEAAQLFAPGNHGSTFGGNPFACRVALTVVQIMERSKLGLVAQQQGAALLNKLRSALVDNPLVADIRGAGMMLGVELARPCAGLVEIALRQGLVINVTADTVIRLLPPLIMSDHECDMLVERLVRALDQFDRKTTA